MSKDCLIVGLWCLPGFTQIVLPLVMGMLYFIYKMSRKLVVKNS